MMVDKARDAEYRRVHREVAKAWLPQALQLGWMVVGMELARIGTSLAEYFAITLALWNIG